MAILCVVLQYDMIKKFMQLISFLNCGRVFSSPEVALYSWSSGKFIGLVIS